MKTFIYSFLVLLFSLESFAQTVIKSCKNGDLVFIKLPNTSSVSADKAKFNCLGIVFIEQGVPMVYYTDDQLRKSTYDDFLKLSVNNKHDIKRLSDTELLSEDVISTMRIYATAKLGVPNDKNLGWGDEALYNPEFIWKLYKQCVGLPLCKTKEVKISALGNAADKMVIVGDIYKSDALTDLEE